MICIIDYDGGNVGSVQNALDYLNIKNIVSDDPNIIEKSDKIVLPGQGRFGDVMRNLRQKKLDTVLIKQLKLGKPYLGICIGLQILFESGDEDPDTKGLGILKGTTPKFRISLKTPQIGWNNVKIMKKSRLFRDIKNLEYFYFVHSYYVAPMDEEIVLATTDYGIQFTCAIEYDNIFALQFHPEKSGSQGLRLIENFCRCDQDAD